MGTDQKQQQRFGAFDAADDNRKNNGAAAGMVRLQVTTCTNSIVVECPQQKKVAASAWAVEAVAGAVDAGGQRD